MESPRRIVVVGGGIAGLAAAHKLRRSIPHVEVVLVERENRLGGKLLTEQIDGFTLEAGPDSFLAGKPAGIRLCHELGIEDRLQGVNPRTRRTFVMRDGRLHDLPEGLSGLVPARLAPMFRSRLLSPAGKLRVALEPFVPARRDGAEETLGGFMRRRMGSEVYQRLIEPLMAGIYGGNGDELSLPATFPALASMERTKGSLIRGLGAARTPGTANQRPSPFLAPRDGMAEIVDALRANLGGVQLLTDRTVTDLQRITHCYTVTVEDDELRADALILATPAFVTADLISALDPEISKLLCSIPYTSTATVYLAYPESALPAPLHGHGYIVPKREGRPVLACTWTSNKFEGRAPEGHVLFRVFLGRAGQEDVLTGTDGDLVEAARAELCDVLGIAAPPQLSRVYRWPRAMPQYTLGHLERVAAIERRVESLPGIFVAGSAYRGVGIPDCIESGELAADRAAAVVGRS